VGAAPGRGLRRRNARRGDLLRGSFRRLPGGHTDWSTDHDELARRDALAGLGFAALIAACFVFARWFSAVDDRGWAVFRRVTGTVFLGTWILTFAVMGSRPANGAFALGIALAVIWASLLAGRAKHG
jgi:hypothetical protein